MKLEYPIGQPFGANYVSWYAEHGLKGHTGVDYQSKYGDPVHSLFEEEYVYKVLDKDHPANDGSGYTAVFTIVDNGIEVFEFQYGHGDPLVKVGDIIKQGTVVMTEANHGDVWSGATKITKAMQDAGDQRGFHIHAQKRLLKKDKVKKDGVWYITGQDGVTPLCINGCYFTVLYPQNGYNGCVDFMAPLFNRDLYFGCRGYDVWCLQNFLKARGFLDILDTTDYFGNQTRLAVIAFQKANGISPLLGYCGKVTRNLINQILQ